MHWKLVFLWKKPKDLSLFLYLKNIFKNLFEKNILLIILLVWENIYVQCSEV